MELREIENLFKELFPIQRSLLGDEVDETVTILRRLVDFEVYEFYSGTNIFDWTVPNAWRLHEMKLKDMNGNLIWSDRSSAFSTVFHSNSYDNLLSLEELRSIVYTREDLPSAVPYRTSYYGDDYGICMPFDLFKTLNDSHYHLKIDTSFYSSSLKVCEYVIHGKSKKEILFTSYFCHPSMANNELSGPISMISLILRLLSINYDGYYTLRFALFPETVGALAFIQLRQQTLRDNLVAGYVLTCIGDAADISFKKSFNESANFDDLSIDALTDFLGYAPQIYDFEPSGSDERQFNSPGLRLSVGTLCRSKFGTYPEYHTDLDDLSLISANRIVDNVDFIVSLIARLNANLIYKRKLDIGELFLTRYNLYNTLGASVESNLSSKAISWFMHLCDGESTVFEMSLKSGLSFSLLVSTAQMCLEKGIVEIVTPK